MGCGKTLAYDAGIIVCSAENCPDSTAATSILEDPITDHLVVISGETFGIMHPLRERLHGRLWSCSLHEALSLLDGPPAPEGTYRITDNKEWIRCD
jgi:hypothetical protein